MVGSKLLYSGQPKEGIAALERAIRVDPYDPMLTSRLGQLAIAYYFDREYCKAVEAAKRAIRSNPDYPIAYRWLAAGLGQLGHQKEAKQALEKALVTAPALVDMFVRERPPWMRSEDYVHILEGLRKAGLERICRKS
jgi:adenylate cyclase